ncbi:Signal recognition particle subunit SRP68 [Neolecta irregularis DAH-3]|uniref:Signal recognition particle subunit SRP68 n=1 Tax=Neolecta irregularis (strain DAH-3) TaxID=1198029 RepID=A0A1U7LV71_NEOID|nr:Signal recognition particle subunit SRP68 [Neolecta irregularis DAH-3]|eukprot:OLL26557.1 Signal recognition particle subunit SRP68 [Neolecta irregularis DAH-3]
MPPPFFHVLSLTSEARNSYGLQLQDYRKYRHYCGRKGAALRKSLQVKSRDAKRLLITADKVIQDKRFLEIVLLDAERCWAYAMDLKPVVERPSRVVRKLQKAVYHAKHLKELVEQCFSDDISVIQVSAYLLDFSAQHKSVKGSLEDSLREFSNCRNILVALDKLESCENVKSMISMLEPNIRYCAYVLGLPSRDISGIAEHFGIEDKDVVCRIDRLDPRVLEPLDESEMIASVSEITWRGKTVQVDNADVGMTLARVQKAQYEVECMEPLGPKARAQAFDGLLLALSEAQDAVQRAVEEEERSLQNEEKIQRLQIALTYTSYYGISKRIERDLLLVEDLLTSPTRRTQRTQRKVVKLYETIISSIEQCDLLPGVAGDFSLAGVLEGKTICAAIARSYDAPATRREALALFERAKQYLCQAKERYSAFMGSTDPILKHNTDMEGAETKICGEAARMRALLVLEESSGGEVEAPLYDRLGVYPKDINESRLVLLEPKIEPIPMKPIFLDIALNFIQYEGDKGDTERERGLFGSLWGRH